VAKQCLSVCGCTSFWRPARWAASLQASQTTLVVIGVSAVCQRLPGNSHTLGLRCNPRQCSRSARAVWAEHHIPVFASLATLDVNDHAFAIDVTDFQVCQFSASYSGGVERHQQSAMIRSQSCVYESRDFFLAEDRRRRNAFFG